MHDRTGMTDRSNFQRSGLLLAETYTPSKYSDPAYRPAPQSQQQQLGYPPPPMDVSQPVQYPHAVRYLLPI